MDAGPDSRASVRADLSERSHVQEFALSFDGKFIEGFLFLPPGADQPGAKFPALVQAHGGGTDAVAGVSAHGVALVHPHRIDP
jgi:hypothetical protein